MAVNEAQQTPSKSPTAGRTQYSFTAVITVAAVALCCLLASYCMRSDTTLASSTLKLNIRKALRIAADECQNAFQCAALANFTSYKARLFEAHLGGFHRGFGKADWHMFQPVITCPPDRPLTKYGKGDGSKLLCKLEGALTEDSRCVIYSLGSKGDYQFEEHMLNNTACQIHTFDCNFNGTSLDKDRRHHYHGWCVGDGGGQYRKWDNITNTLGHQRVNLLKMDIEGFEYAVLASFRKQDALPEEIAMELHVKTTNKSRSLKPESRGELAFAFLHLADLGYAAYAQEVNTIAPNCCSEFAFMRVTK